MPALAAGPNGKPSTGEHKHETKLFCLGIMLGFTLAAQAQESEAPKAEVGVNYSFTHVNPRGNLSSYTANGGSAYVEYNVNRVLGLVADFGGNYIRNDKGTSLANTTFTYLFGPRFNLRKSRFTSYVQTLVGGARFSNAFNATLPSPSLGRSENTFAAAIGGGVDVRLTHHLLLKPGQVEYFLTHLSSTTQNVDFVGTTCATLLASSSRSEPSNRFISPLWKPLRRRRLISAPERFCQQVQLARTM
jgi:hypothetical protein